MEMKGTGISNSNFKKKNQVEVFSLPDVKIYYLVTVIEIVW
jgi:hypothetical protein